MRHHVAATLGGPDELPAAVRALTAHAATLPAGEPLLVDFYARDPAPDDLDRLLSEGGLPPAVARVVFVLFEGDVRDVHVGRLTARSGRTATCAACIR